MIDYSDPTIGPQLGESTGEVPFFAKVLESVPSMKTTALWNVGRVKNTMLGGSKEFRRATRIANRSGRFGREAKAFEDVFRSTAGTGGFLKQGFSNTVRPSRFRRFSRAAAIDSANYAADAKMYSPFQLAHLGNMFTSGELEKMPVFGRFMKGKKIPFVSNLNKALTIGDEAHDAMPMFSSGVFGRATANRRIAMMSAEKFEAKAPAIFNSIKDIGGPKGAALGMTEAADSTAARMGITAGVRSKVGGRIMGYLDVAQEFKMAGRGAAGLDAATEYASQMALKLGGEGGNMAAVQGGFKAVEHLAGEGAGSMLAKAAPYAIKGLEVGSMVGTALLVRDAMHMVGVGIGSMVKTGLQAVKSIQGSIDKPIFGMGYKDNEVAATSRQRGVMAIQNSQLNARSILGSEASGLHAHFG
jgi:hypothetical protein